MPTGSGSSRQKVISLAPRTAWYLASISPLRRARRMTLRATVLRIREK
jgi:hypothetical protein